jgi:hypothetical protein
MRTRREKEQLDDGIQIVASRKDQGNPQTQPCVYTPIQQRQNQEEKVFITQRRKEYHRQLEPAAKRLNGNNPVNSVLDESVHAGLL